MTKKALKDNLASGACLTELFNLTDGQDCMIYKGKFEVSDQIIYIPDVDLNEIETDTVLEDEAIANVLNHCCTGNDFVEACQGHEELAKELFEFVDWQHPNVQDLLDCYDEETFKERYGFAMETFG